MAVGSDRKARNLWTDEEDEILRGEVARQAELGIVNDWRSIAEKLPGRTNKDCRKRWIKLDGLINKGPWSKDEDSRLREGVRRHSNIWTEVSRVVGTRNTDQCAKRWLHFLNPELNHSAWTEQDDENLLAEVEKNGNNWRKIVDEVLEGRSATDAKNRYTILQRNKRNGSASNGAGAPRTRRRKTSASLQVDSNQPSYAGAQRQCPSNGWPLDMMDFTHINNQSSPVGAEAMLLNDAFDDNFLTQQNSAGEIFSNPCPAQFSHGASIGSFPGWQDSRDSNILTTGQTFPGSLTNLPGTSPRYMARGSTSSISSQHMADESYSDAIFGAAGKASSASGQINTAFADTPDLTHTTTPRDDDLNDDIAQFLETHGMDETEDKPGIPKDEHDRREVVDPVQSWDASSGDNGSRRSKMVVQNMRPELVGQVLELLFQSDSAVDVNISSES